MAQQSFYKKYNISEKREVKSINRKGMVTAVAYDFPDEIAEGGGVLEIHNVMGQEDVYRTDPDTGVRVDNSLRGRIVWSTTVSADSKVYYSPNTVALNLESDLENVAPDGVLFHELFLINLDIDSLYAFEVESNTVDGQTVRSETFYFRTGDSIGLDNLNLEVAVAIIVDAINYFATIELELPSVSVQEHPKDVDISPAIELTQTEIFNISDTPSHEIDTEDIYTETLTLVS